MATEQSIDHLVGLAVAMLGVAPGTDWLNERAKQLDGGATLADIANEIQSSTGFEDEYPAFLTNERFAKEFLEALLGDNVTDTAMMAAVDFVAGQLAGATRGELALALVDALTTIAREGEDNALHADFGKAAAAFHNKVMVAKHYTEEAREADPSASVLEGVTDDPATVMAAKDAIDNPPAPPESMEGQRYVLTPTIDDIEGTDFDDTFVAAPVQGADRNFSETLNAFDSIDGGGGSDTILVSGDGDVDIALALVSNIETANIRAPGSINADMSEWAGLESVEIGRFGSDSAVTVVVDGASVEINERLTIGGAATIVGAKGAVDIKAGSGSAVHVGSAGHTETVMVTGGASVLVDNGAGKQSQTVKAVVVDDVQHNKGTNRDPVPDGKFKPMVDDDGFVVGADGTTRVGLSADADGDDTPDSFIRLTLANDGVTLQNGGPQSGGIATGMPITITFTHGTGGSTSDITARLRFDADNGGIELGEVTASGDTSVLTLAAAKTMYEGKAIPSTEVVVPTPSIGREPTGGTMPDPRGPEGGGATLTVNSDAIEMVHLHNTTATVLVNNNSMTADKEPMPEDLELTVNKYGDKVDKGKLCVAGSGSAHNIALMVEGDSWVNLNSNAVKALDVTANAKLDLGVYKFDANGNQNGASNTLETVKITGAGDVTMAALAGLAKLKTIDAGMSEGKSNHFKSTAALAALETVMGGSGKDKVELFSAASGTGSKLEAIHTRGGDDTVKITGAHRTKGLEVNLGEGDDTFEGNSGGSKDSRIDGGEGVDTLKLSAPDATFKDGTATKSIYSNFEILDVGGGAGEYDVGRLGVDTVVAMGGTATGGAVTLKNMADGMGITVHGTEGMDTTAMITHELPEDLRRSSRELDVTLLALGGENDTKAGTAPTSRTGELTLTLTADSDIQGLTVDSSAEAGGSEILPATARPSAANYHNKLKLAGDSATEVEDITVTGNARLTIEGANGINLIDARDNNGGVTFSGGSQLQDMDLLGGGGVDTFTGGAGDDEIEGGGGNDVLMGGAGDDEIEGGAGGDTLTGGAGDDKFVIRAVSDSQLSFNAAGTMALGMDTITDFRVGSNDIVLPKSLFDSFQGTIKGGGGQGTANVTTGGNGATTLKDHLEASLTKNGFFETTAPTSNGFGGTISKHSVAVIREDTDGGGGVNYTWIFIDIDADGDLDLSTDHAIRLTGDLAIGTGDFMASS